MKALALAFVGLFLLLFACIQTPEQPPAAPTPSEPVVVAPAPIVKTETPAVEAQCTSGSILDKDDCFSLLASSSNSIDWCSMIYSSDLKDQCIYKFAKSDGTLCGKLFGSTLRSDCYALDAQAKKDFELCALVGDEAKRAQCLRTLTPPCLLLPEGDARSTCLALEKSDSSICGSTECAIAYALNKSDNTACGQIPKTELAAISACNAIAKRDASLCENGGNSVVADYCYQIYSIRMGNLPSCDLATLGSPYRNDCYNYFAAKLRDPEVCKRAAPEELRDQCYMNYSITTSSPTVCEKVINTLNRAKCYITTAKVNGNPTACTGLYYQDQKNCYNIVFTGTGVKNPAYCSQIDDALWKDKCYINAAEIFRNVSLCKFVQDADQNAKCIVPFGRQQ